MRDDKYTLMFKSRLSGFVNMQRGRARESWCDFTSRYALHGNIVLASVDEQVAILKALFNKSI